jgi:integrase
MVAFLEATQHVKRSAEDDKLHARRLGETFAGKIMNQLKAADVRAYIHRRLGEGVSNATVNRELSLLSAAINYCNREDGWGLPNPVTGRKLPEPESRVRWITRTEAAALLQAAEIEAKAPYLADFVRVALYTGCRKEELLGLEWKRVDLQKRLILLEAHHTKAKRRRSVPLNQHAYDAMIGRARFRAQHCPASPWVFADREGDRVHDIRKGFYTACGRAGIDDFHVHDLRHTCAAWLVSSGAPLPAVRDLLGHSTIAMTEKYAHLAPEAVRSAVALLDGDQRGVIALLDEGLSRFGHGQKEGP